MQFGSMKAVLTKAPFMILLLLNSTDIFFMTSSCIRKISGGTTVENDGNLIDEEATPEQSHGEEEKKDNDKHLLSQIKIQFPLNFLNCLILGACNIISIIGLKKQNSAFLIPWLVVYKIGILGSYFVSVCILLVSGDALDFFPIFTKGIFLHILWFFVFWTKRKMDCGDQKVTPVLDTRRTSLTENFATNI